VKRRLGTWLFLSLTAVGCATTGTLQNGVFHGERTSYRIGPVSSDWTAVTVDRQNDLAWHNEAKGAVMQVDSKCASDLDIPLKALRNHLMIGYTDRKVIQEEVVPMDGREALRTHFTAALDGVPREMLLQILKKDGCVYDFSMITPDATTFGEALPDFDRLIAGFGTMDQP
jgi:hypothetical protein